MAGGPWPPATGEVVQVDGLALDRAQRRSLRISLVRRLLPSMEFATPASVSTKENSRLVTWLCLGPC